MKRTKIRLILCSAALAGLLAFIWGNSAMPGQTSGQLSGWAGEFLCKLLPFLDLQSERGAHILRKLAHFSEFAALGMTLTWLFGMLLTRPMARLGLPLLCGVCAACIDETIQRFSPGRHCSIVDVGIDSSGVLTGILCLTVLCLLWNKLRKKQPIQ